MKSSSKQVHIFVGNTCNNKCIFCSDNDNIMPRDKRIILKEISSGKKLKNIIFVCKEPTLNKDLHEYIIFAKKQGYDNISITTNGRMISYNSFLNKLFHSGLNEIVISMHGYNSKTHDMMTQAPSSFIQTRKALENIKSLRKTSNLRFGIATTVTKKNLKNIEKTFAFTKKFNPDYFIFNIFEPKANARNKLFLIPKYTEVISLFGKIIINSKSELYLSEMPSCLSLKLGRHAGSNKDQFTSNTEDKLSRITFNNEKTKRKECSSCIHNPKCDGVWKDYIKKYGWKEFVPVKNI